MALYTVGILLLDLISKMASMKDQKFEFEVPIIATTISMIVSLGAAGIFMLLQGLQRLFSFHLENNYMFLCFLPNTLKWIVVQKIIVHLANRHNELKTLRQLKKFRENRLRQHEASQFQRRLKIPAKEGPQNSESKKQFDICTKRERLDEGVFMKKKPNPNRKVGFSPKFYKKASTVDDIDQMNLS